MDLIRRQDAITIPILPKEHRKYQTMNLDDAYELGWLDCQKYIEDLPPTQPDNQIHLCYSCEYDYPDCPCEYNDVIFGNGIGNDNICACNKYKPSTQPEQKISTNVLDKIRAEIEQEYKVESAHPYGQGLRRALEIIDKHKAESEGE